MTNTFNQLGVSEQLVKQLQLNGITEPTPIQKEAIPALLKGTDLIAKAQTGTGKTLAFILPILMQVRPHKDQVQALILTPTRELAIQITSELKKLASAVNATVLACYGGQDVTAQVKKLQNAPQIVVATPGRLLDHLRRESINIGKITHFVLDEADQMLHMGFLPDVESVIMQTPKTKQTMLFSATMPDAIRQLAAQYMNKPQFIEIQSQQVTLDNIKQRVVETTDRGKQAALIQLLRTHNPFLAVIFCRTKLRASKLTEALQEEGFNADELHGDLTQAKREQVMKRFRDMKLQILVATDVAARGLDVEGVSHVYNYDIPLDAESYIHRIGRTGRAGHTGYAVTFATARDMGKLEAIERGIKQKIVRRKPDQNDAMPGKGDDYARPAAKKPRQPRNEDRNRKPGQAGSAANSAGVKAKPKQKKDNPWEITKSDLEIAQGKLPKGSSSGKKSSSSSRSKDRSKTKNQTGRGGRSGGRGRR